MLQYERIDVSGGTDINESNKSKECIICHYWYFKDISFVFEPCVWDKCHDTMMPYELENIAILNVNGVDYRCVL